MGVISGSLEYFEPNETISKRIARLVHISMLGALGVTAERHLPLKGNILRGTKCSLHI